MMYGAKIESEVTMGVTETAVETASGQRTVAAAGTTSSMVYENYRPGVPRASRTARRSTRSGW